MLQAYCYFAVHPVHFVPHEHTENSEMQVKLDGDGY